MFEQLIWFCGGIALGSLVTYLITRSLAEKERKFSEEKLTFFSEAKEKLEQQFQAASVTALESNRKAFLDLAGETFGKLQEAAKGDLEQKKIAIQEMVKPLQVALTEVNKNVHQIEKARHGAYEALRSQVKALNESQQQLAQETGKLVTSLRRPSVRGRWGEVQLRRVVEIAGMVAHCDFLEQESVSTAEGVKRPDMVVQLPGNKSVVVDAKAPLEAYLEAVDAEDEERKREQLVRHARHIKNHINQLSSKSYWQQFESSPEFVVLFLPGESFFSAALEHDPTLIEYGMKSQVVIATPTTLIALLRSVAFGWDQEQVAKNALEIRKLGSELHDRLSILTNHFLDMRKGLERAVSSYNKAVGAFETRVLVSARRFKEIGAVKGAEIGEMDQIESVPRSPQQSDSLSSQSHSQPPKLEIENIAGVDSKTDSKEETSTDLATDEINDEGISKVG